MPSQGSALETALSAYHERLSDSWIIKQNPRMRRAGRRMFPVGDGPPDYLGFVGHLPVCFEAKEFSDEQQWKFLLLKQHQAEDLTRAQVHGAESFLIIAHAPLIAIDRAWFVPWGVLSPMWHQWHDGWLQGVRSKPRAAGVWLDTMDEIGTPLDGVAWLPAMRAHRMTL